MSRLRIEHLTRYRYRQNVSFGPHRLVLRPREGHDLRLESMQLDISPTYRLTWSRDVYSNCVAHVHFLEPALELRIQSTTVIDRITPFPSPEEVSPPPPTLQQLPYSVLESPVIAAYQTLSFPDDALPLTDWVKQLTPTNDGSSLSHQLCSLIRDTIRYQRRSTKGVQSPAETLTLQSGSCRDMATLMMDATRVLGLASRFVSGYLDCAASEAGRASTHAWTEVYLPVVGWQGYDPTLGACTSLKHIPMGVSQHPRGVMPISGEFRGTPNDYLGMDVAVKIEKLNDPRT